MLKTVLEDAKGSRLEGISFGDVKADLHYTETVSYTHLTLPTKLEV